MSIIRDGLQSADLDVPVTSPTLNLDFANSQKLDPRITFTRGSIGTRVNRNRLIETVSANQPRFDYDPVTGECKGLLIEESRSNLFLYSEDFTNANWSKSQSSITTTSITAPNGTTAFKLVENTVGGVGHFINQGSITKSSNAVLTLTIFAKAAERRYLGLVINSSSTGFGNRYGAEFDLINGTGSEHDPAQGTYSSGSFSITPFPNGWYRCRVTCTTSTDAQSQVRIFTFRDTNQWTSSSAHQGDGTSGIYIWGAQLEAGAFPTSYIPTTASTVTRSADLASITGTNFSSWYNSSEGTLYAAARVSALGGNTYPGIVYVDDGTIGNSLGIYVNDAGNDTVAAEAYVSGRNQYAIFSTSAIIPNQLTKAITAYQQNYFTAAFSNRTSVGLDISGSVPTVNRLVIGALRGNVYYLNGTISRLTYYPKALSPSQLQYLTT